VNRLYFGDSLTWLSDRKEFPDASIDLVYLDPPFNSNADYNVLFRRNSAPSPDTSSWADVGF
jgi:site-specific DNA-methyltransferase (adenine-specific)